MGWIGYLLLSDGSKEPENSSQLLLFLYDYMKFFFFAISESVNSSLNTVFA